MLPRFSLVLVFLIAAVQSRDLFDDAEEDQSNEAAMNITGPGIPKYNDTEPHHYLETRLNWKKCDLNKDGSVNRTLLRLRLLTRVIADGRSPCLR